MIGPSTRQRLLESFKADMHSKSIQTNRTSVGVINRRYFSSVPMLVD
jgi:hypothetical protein